MAVTVADIGLIGLAVLGENLVLNMENHGYTVAVHNAFVLPIRLPSRTSRPVLTRKNLDVPLVTLSNNPGFHWF